MTSEAPTTDAREGAPAIQPAWREVYVLSGMRGLSFAGDIITETAILLTLQSRGAGAYAVSALLLAATVPAVLLSPITGKVADRFDSRQLIVTVALLQALVCVAMTIWTSPAALIGLSVLLSAGLAFTHPVFGGLPRSMVGRENVARASSISQGTAMAGMIAAPAIGGFLIGRFGLTAPLLIDAASFLLVLAGGLYIRTRLHARRGQASAGGADEPTDVGYRVRSDRFLRSVLILSGTVMACASLVNVLIVFYVRQTFGASAETFGLIVSTWMVGLLPGAYIVNKVKSISHEKLLIASFVCLGIAIFGVGLAPGVWWVVPFYILGGIGNGMQATVTHVLLNLRIPDSHRGRAFAVLGAVSNTGPAIGFVIGGVALSFVEPRVGFLVAGVLVLVATLAFAPGMRGTAPPVAVGDEEPNVGTAATV